MASTRQVVVQGGGDNLYEIGEYNGRYTAYKVDVSFLGNTKTSIGTARKLEDAVSLIRAHSGRQIKYMG
jgi:hypothetical protein